MQVHVLGLARANNAAIMLAAFGDVPGGAAGLRTALLTGTPPLGADRLALLVQVCPLSGLLASHGKVNNEFLGKRCVLHTPRAMVAPNFLHISYIPIYSQNTE